MIFMCNNRYKAIRIQLEHESIAGNIHIRVTKSNFSLLLNFNETTLMEQLCIRFVLFVFLINSSIADRWEDVNLICPQHCVCQFSHKMDLSISRWIYEVETRQRKGHEFNMNHDDPINNNEVTYEDDAQLENELLKFVMCLLPSDTEPKDLIASLPHDVEALVILTMENRNLSVLVSDFNQLFDLRTLEIRSIKDTHFTLRFDEPLSWVHHLYLESIHIEAAETMQFRPNIEKVDPSQNFNYVPNCEKFKYNISFETLDIVKDVEIVPYEIYKTEKLTAELRLRMISFYGWDNLKVLRMRACEMDTIYWEMFDGLSRLEHLSLENNGIKEIPPFSFYGTMNIKTLSLAHNEILDLGYRSLAGLLELQMLDLSYNNIGKLSEQTFPPFPKLEIVDLRQNPIKNVFPSTFGVMNKTEVLYVGSDGMPLELNAKKPFEHLTSLIYLEIANLNIPMMDQSTFASLDRLEILKINSGSVPYVEFDTFSKMVKLKELHMRNCNIEEISMDTFFGAKNLEIIDLSKNVIRIIPPGLFDDQHDLLEIRLNDNQITSLPSDIFKLNSLKMISLINNPWDCTCDMKFWRQSITNKVRSKKVENKCSGNTLKDNKQNCDSSTITTYAFDHKMSPKCKTPSEVEKKNVFYVLRKLLRCAPAKVTVGPTTQKPESPEQKKDITRQKYENQVKDIRRRKQIAQRNTLKYQLFQSKNNEHVKSPSFDGDISNDL